jgi:DNA-binding transcriptional MocR family regulator
MLTGKKFIKVFTTLKEADIKISDLGIYCYRAYRDEWERVPGIRKMSEGTGLSKDTVEAADQRLQEMGLLNADLTVNPPPEGLFVKVTSLSGKHWRHRYGYWYLYVRNPRTANGIVSYLQIALFSYLYHCEQTGSKDKRRWTVSYLASVLRCSRNTVTQGLDALATEGFLQYRITHNRLTYSTSPLGDHQLSMIQDATEDRSASCSRSPVAPARMPDADEPKPDYGSVVEAIVRVGEYGNEYDRDHARWLADSIYASDSFSAASIWDINSVGNAVYLHLRRLRLERLCGTIDDDVYCPYAGQEVP